MLDLPALQTRIYQNKLNKHFNVTDIPLEFCLLQGEVSEAFAAYDQKDPTLGEELADVAIYLLGLAEIVGVNLEAELLRKVEKNERRQYIQKDGVTIRITDG